METEEQSNKPTVYVVFTSHRARGKGLQAMGEPKPQAYYSWQRETGKGVYLVNETQLAKLNGLKGWRRLRGPHDDMIRCLNWD